MKKCIICGGNADPFISNLFDDRYGAPGYYTVLRCKKCGFGRTTPPLKKERISNFYRNYYPLTMISPDQVKKSANKFPQFLRFLTGTNNSVHRNIGPGKKVLDIGSGSGVSLIEIKNAGSIAYGVEPDPNAQKIARKLNLKLYKGFITDNPFPGEKFDCVTASQVLEHEPDPLVFLRSAGKRIKDKGFVMLSFPNMDSLYRQIFQRRWLNWHVPYHINFFTKRSIIILANKAGLKVSEIKTVTPNDWTLMQLRTFFMAGKEGKKNPIWTNAASNHVSVKQDKNVSVSSIALRTLVIIFNVLITPINRIIDMAGMGDSFYVILKK